MRNLFLVATIAALAHGAPHHDSHHELEPLTDAHHTASHSATPSKRSSVYSYA